MSKPNEHPEYGILYGEVPQGKDKPSLKIYKNGNMLYFIEGEAIWKSVHIDDLEDLLKGLLEAL